MNTQKELEKAASEIYKLNPRISLSGTLGLRLQCSHYPNRPVGDLDFELPYGQKVNFSNGLVENDFDNDDYSEATHDLISATYNGIKVNFFQARKAVDEIKDCEPCFLDDGSETGFMIPVIRYQKILERKMYIVFECDGSPVNQIKHANDLIEILTKELERIQKSIK